MYRSNTSGLRVRRDNPEIHHERKRFVLSPALRCVPTYPSGLPSLGLDAR